MSIKSNIIDGLQRIADQLEQSLNDTPAYQTLKTKYEELDQRSKSALKSGGVGVLALISLFLLLSASSRVSRLKADLAEKNELIRLLQSSNEELRRLKDEAAAAGMSTRGGEKEDSVAWNAHFESIATTSGLTKEALSISGEKAGGSGEQTRESLFDLTLKKVNIRQVSKFAAAIETGIKPVKIRTMTIDAKPDGSAWLDATLSVSAFSMKPQQ